MEWLGRWNKDQVSGLSVASAVLSVELDEERRCGFWEMRRWDEVWFLNMTSLPLCCWGGV